MNENANEIYDWLEKETERYFLAVVFGSYARGEAHSTSDVDVLLIDPKFTGWTVLSAEESTHEIGWKSKFPPLHLVCTSKEEFESRYETADETQNMVSELVEDGFAVNEEFGLVDYLKTL